MTEPLLSEHLSRSLARRRKSKEWPYGHSLSVKKVAQLQAIGKDTKLSFAVAVTRAYQQTSNRIDDFARQVREGKSVMEANVFCQFVMFALLPLFESFEDGRCVSLRSRVKDVISNCGDMFRTGKADPKYAQSDIAEINTKLDALMSLVSKPVNLAADVPSETFLLPSGEVSLSLELSAQKGCQPLQLGGQKTD